MRLQSLEIKGFKSFARDTVIHFNEHVTGIVGPNGSGKSNIIDAIRWVLGEQKSKELRLEKMHDVIFNGTKSKKKAPSAEVSIVFENNKSILPSEYHIVRISRILYRSGESEYRLNDLPCRLKDINNLLVDSGIGSNSYAIIELGMVDDILQDKDHARRKMFEQAAGISKYKKRKSEALSKLNLTQNDLDRVEDLLFEISGNLKALEKQARRAQRYLDLKANYKQTSLLFHAVKLTALRDDFMALEKEITSHQVQYHQLRATIDRKEAKLEQEKLKNINDEKQLSLFQQKISSITDNIRKQENRKAMLEKEASYSSDKLKGMDRRKDELKEKMHFLAEAIKKIKDRVAIEHVELSDLNSKYEESQRAYNDLRGLYEDNKAQVELKEQQKIEFEKQQLHIEKEIAIADNKIQQAQHTIEFLKNRSQDQLAKVVDEKDQLSKLTLEIENLQRRQMELQAAEDQKKEKLDALREDIDLAKNERRDIQRKRDVKQNEIDLLQSMINKLEGFPESVKYLHKTWKKEQIILSDVISCSEQDRPAVELAMGDFLDYYVVDTSDDALEAIQLLKTAKRGKARFFILDRIPKLVKQNETDLVPMLNLIQCADKYKSLIQYILYDTYQASGQEAFDDTGLKHVNLISKDGSIMSKNGQFIGGSINLFEGKKIGRKKKLEQLIADKEQLSNQFQTIRSNIERLEKERVTQSEINHAAEIKELQRDIDGKTRLQYKLQASVDSVEQNLSQQNDAKTDQESTIALNEENLLRLRLEKQEISDKLEVLVPQLSHKGTLNKLSEDLARLSKQMNDDQIAKLKQQNLIENFEKENTFNTEKLAEAEQEFQSIEKRKGREIQAQEDRTVELAKLKGALQEEYQARKVEQADLGGIEQSYFDAKHRIGEEEQEVRKLNKVFTELQSKINLQKDRAADLKYKLQGIKQRINIEFSENIDAFEYEIPEGYSIGEQEIRIEKMQNRLSNFGEINPMAVEAYKEMEERKLNIEAQRDDINQAKEELIATMEEIESTATKLFLEAFDQVRKHFVTVFRSLFTQDDDCDLVLLDPENPLQSNIEIIAKPKGKRPQSLSQLSGGEKTLTASALLFSLYLLKPAPFCIFDEVDAPLDDQNVQKFTNIIRAFSQDSQFLVVTHNKATMAELDVLYGVYMEEKGVSSVSEVDFRNYDHDPVMSEAVG